MTLDISDEEWKQKLSPEQYQVLRQGATEAPFTGKLLENHDSGDYACAACGQVVFQSGAKFDSGSGWPSFYDPANTQAVHLVEDNSQGMHRVEVRCGHCDSHLGHVFDDAIDQPTGMRFCVNSAALEFLKKG